MAIAPEIQMGKPQSPFVDNYEAKHSPEGEAKLEALNELRRAVYKKFTQEMGDDRLGDLKGYELIENFAEHLRDKYGTETVKQYLLFESLIGGSGFETDKIDFEGEDSIIEFLKKLAE